MSRAVIVVVASGCLLSAACSVSVPRHGLGAAPAARGATAGEAAGSSDGTQGNTVIGSTDTVGATPSAQRAAGSLAPGSSTHAVPHPSAAASRQGARNQGPTAGAGGKAPGVTRDTITVSVIAGFSGPLAAMVDKAYGGLQTWQSDVNAAGGINGRKVQLIQVDHKETSDGGVAACKEALSNGSYVALIAEGVDANVTAASCLDAAGMPSFGFVGAFDPSWKRVFSDSINVPQAGRVMASYVRNVVGGPSRKAGVIYVNQLAYKGLSDTFVPEARRLGLTVADVESVEPNQASFTAELTRLKQAGVQNLVISATAEAIGILRDAKSIGYTPTFSGWGMTFDFMTVAGRSLFDGVTGLRTNATVDTPAFQRYEARMAANGRGTDRSADTEAFVGYGHALVLGEMLKKAGPQPTWASFLSGAESIRGFDSGVFPPLTFGPGSHIGTQAAFPALCCNSDWTWRGRGPARAEF